MASKSKILFVGGTGYIGKFIVEASVKAGHPTFVLVRELTLADHDKFLILDKFRSLGVHLIVGDLHDHENLVKAMRQVDVVISIVGHYQIHLQDKLISAIKAAGNVKRFFASEFGNDVDRVHAVEPAKTAFSDKAKVRRALEAEGVPHTIVSANFFAGIFLRNLWQPGAAAPPRDKITIFGDGSLKAIFNSEEDIGTYTVRAVDDPRTLNKILYLRPPANIYSLNELVLLWEKKIGKTIQRVYLSEEQLLRNIQVASPPLDLNLSVGHCVFIKGNQTNFEVEPLLGVEATELYPDVKYTSADEYLNQFV